MTRDWLLTTWEAVALVLVSAVAIYATVIVLTRLNGLRSFAKMSAFDFAMTIAVGTLISSTLATGSPPLLQAIVALAALFGLQFGVARLRIGSSRFKATVDNSPILLMRGGEMLRENMSAARITEGDLWGQLRAANVLDPREVRAVVLETTGDVSVLHTADDTAHLDARVLTGVRS